MRKSLFIAALAIGFATPAFAFQCPGNVATIDAALSSSQLSGADKAKVKALRDTGLQQHKAGKHAAALKTLGSAMKMLGM